MASLNSDFLLLHAATHRRFRRRGDAVLGKICWPEMDKLDVNYVMYHIQGEGEQQFGYRDKTPYGWYSWSSFWSSNVSVKRHLVEDWLDGGYNEKFNLAALETRNSPFASPSVSPGKVKSSRSSIFRRHASPIIIRTRSKASYGGRFPWA